MATYIVLANFTDKGIHEAKDTIKRADKFKEMAKSAGVTVKDMYWTIGTSDIVTICEAPDDETATALSLSVEPEAISGRKRCAPSQRPKSPKFSTNWFEARPAVGLR